MPNLSMPEILVIGFLLLVFFGKNKLPEAARSIGQSFKAFKEEINLDKMMETEPKTEKNVQMIQKTETAEKAEVKESSAVSDAKVENAA